MDLWKKMLVGVFFWTQCSLQHRVMATNTHIQNNANHLEQCERTTYELTALTIHALDVTPFPFLHYLTIMWLKKRI